MLLYEHYKDAYEHYLNSYVIWGIKINSNPVRTGESYYYFSTSVKGAGMNEFARNNEIVEYSIKHYDLDAKKDGITTLLPNNSIGKYGRLLVKT